MSHLQRIRALEESLRSGFNLARALRAYAESGELPRDADLAAMVEDRARRLEELVAAMEATVPGAPTDPGWGGED
jgi:hypothetical protein